MADLISKPVPNCSPNAMVSELMRELGMREKVYGKWVSDHRMTQAQKDHRINTLKDVLAVIEELYADELRPAQAGLI